MPGLAGEPCCLMKKARKSGEAKHVLASLERMSHAIGHDSMRRGEACSWHLCHAIPQTPQAMRCRKWTTCRSRMGFLQQPGDNRLHSDVVIRQSRLKLNFIQHFMSLEPNLPTHTGSRATS